MKSTPPRIIRSLPQREWYPLELAGRKVAILPFIGVEFREPEEFTIVNQETILSRRAPVNNQVILRELERRKLLPLTSKNPKLPYLLKILGFTLGDGSLTLTPRTHGVWFYGKKGDLKTIRKDIEKIGFKPSRIYTRVRQSHISTKYSTYDFEFQEHSFAVRARR